MPLTQRLLLGGLLLTACFSLPTSARALPDEVRVRLFEEAAPQALVVQAERGLRFFAGDNPDNVVAELAPGEAATIRIRGKDVYVQTSALSFFALSLRVIPRGGGFLNVEVLEGATPLEPRRYPGRLTLEVDPSGTPVLKLVNHVALDDYVACVVAREYGFDDLEGAKAMAVLARTYALRNAGASGDDYDLVDHHLAQQYDGIDPLTDTATDAARQTQSEVLAYNGELVEAVYFSSSGGHTADNDAVWEGRPVPYLRGVADPYDAASPHATWRSIVPREGLLRALSTRYDFEVEGFYVGDRSRDGRVASIELIHRDRTARVIRGNEFRLLVNQQFGAASLKSTLFDVERHGDAYVFEGHGFGHGVGLSQYGALEMSRRGVSYRDILAFYFTGVQVQHLDGELIQPFVTEAPASDAAEQTTKKSRRRGW